MKTSSAPVTIKGVCLDPSGRVLLCRNGRDEWELPGGRPEVGEAFPDCLVREVREETGLSASVERLLDAFPLEVIIGRWVNVIVYACALLAGQTPVASEEHSSVALIEPGDLPAESMPQEYRRAIERYLQVK